MQTRDENRSTETKQISKNSSRLLLMQVHYKSAQLPVEDSLLQICVNFWLLVMVIVFVSF